MLDILEEDEEPADENEIEGSAHNCVQEDGANILKEDFVVQRKCGL